MSKAKGSPRKFSEKIALLNKKEAEATAEFEKILKEVEETTRTPTQPSSISQHDHQFRQPGHLYQVQHQVQHQHQHQHHQQLQQPKQYYGLPQRSSSFSNWQQCEQQPTLPQQNHGHFLTQHVQYNSNQLPRQQNHEQTTPAGVYMNQHHHQQQQQQQQHQQDPYASPPAQQHRVQSYQRNIQPCQQLILDHIDVSNDSVQAASLEVPNIEIYPIDGDQTYQQVGLTTTTSNNLTDGHYRCSNSLISSARSLPNISSLSEFSESEKILNGVEEAPHTSSQLPPTLQHNHHLQQPGSPYHQSQLQQEQKQYYGLPQRSSSFSNWQRCEAQPLSQNQNPGQFLTQHVQYNSNQVSEQQRLQQQQAHDQTTPATMYVDRQQQQDPYTGPPAQEHQAPYQQSMRPAQQLMSDHVDISNDSIQPPSLEVPNIEIYPIDDSQSYQQVSPIVTPTPNILSDGHFRRDCSNSLISSTRSLPNISNLSVSQQQSHIMDG